MKRSFTILLIGVVLLASALATWYLLPKPVVSTESFEEDLGGWTEDADVPPDPNNPGHDVAWDISRVTSLAYSGQYSVEIYIDGKQDDGTVWIEKRLFVKNSSRIQVEVSFQFHSEQESFNVIAGVCAFVGNSDPAVEADFTVLGPANEVAGWKKYTHTATLTTGSTGEVWVALGITVRWETEMTYHIDDVKVEIA
jgi:hypothetical protein